MKKSIMALHRSVSGDLNFAQNSVQIFKVNAPVDLFEQCAPTWGVNCHAFAVSGECVVWVQSTHLGRFRSMMKKLNRNAVQL